MCTDDLYRLLLRLLRGLLLALALGHGCRLLVLHLHHVLRVLRLRVGLHVHGGVLRSQRNLLRLHLMRLLNNGRLI